MKSIYKKQPANILNAVDDLTDADLAILKLRELREQRFLREAKRARPASAPVGIYIFITITVFIALYLLTQAL